MSKPDMSIWTQAWRSMNATQFQSLYAREGMIIPPGKSAVKGNTKILDFMRGGMGKVDVLFEAEKLTIDSFLAFEIGTFKDVEAGSGKLIARGTYAISWILENDQWRILTHSWSIPE